MKAAEDSVSSPLRIAGSVCAGLGLLGAGVVWGLFPELPFGGWSAGSSLILSGLILFALLIWSYRKVQARREAQAARGSDTTKPRRRPGSRGSNGRAAGWPRRRGIS